MAIAGAVATPTAVIPKYVYKPIDIPSLLELTKSNRNSELVFDLFKSPTTNDPRIIVVVMLALIQGLGMFDINFDDNGMVNFDIIKLISFMSCGNP